MGSSSERSSAPESQLLSRRTLVRAGATAAWSVPLVQVVGAAPAFAGSTDPDLKVLLPSGEYQSNSRLYMTATVKNAGTVMIPTVTLDFAIPNGATSSTLQNTAFQATTTPTSFTTASLAPGEERQIMVTFVVTSTAGQTVTITANSADANQGLATVTMAGASQSASLVWSSLEGHYSTSNNQLIVSGTMQNSSANRDASDVSITLTLPQSASSMTTSSDWTVAGSGASWTLQRSTLATGDSKSFALSFAVGPMGAGGSISADVTATNSVVPGNKTVPVDKAPATTSWVQDIAGTYQGLGSTMLVTGSVKSTGPWNALDVTIPISLPVPASAPTGLPTGWSAEAGSTGSTWILKPGSLTTTAVPMSITFPVTNGGGGALSATVKSSNAADQNSSSNVKQQSAVLRVTQLASLYPTKKGSGQGQGNTDRTQVNLSATVANVAIAGSKPATGVKLTMTLLRTAHPEPTALTSGWTSSGSGSTYNFVVPSTFALAASGPDTSMSATLNYGSETGANTFTLKCDPSSADGALSDGQKTVSNSAG